MKFYQEVTVWSGDTPNHVYYLSDDRRKMVGYIRAGTKKLTKFSTPMSFDTKGRKFVLLDRPGEPDTVYFPREKESGSPGIQVAGSGGKMYTVSKHSGGWSCTCPGYQFRRKCRHIEQVATESEV